MRRRKGLFAFHFAALLLRRPIPWMHVELQLQDVIIGKGRGLEIRFSWVLLAAIWGNFPGFPSSVAAPAPFSVARWMAHYALLKVCTSQAIYRRIRIWRAQNFVENARRILGFLDHVSQVFSQYLLHLIELRNLVFKQRIKELAAWVALFCQFLKRLVEGINVPHNLCHGRPFVPSVFSVRAIFFICSRALSVMLIIWSINSPHKTFAL